MAQNDLLKRYLDAGMTFTQLTEKKAKAIVKDLVKTGEIQTKDAGRRVEELLDRSRKNTDAIRALVQTEVANQLKKLGLTGKSEAKPKKAPAAKKPATKKATPVKKTVKKAATKKATTKKAAAPTPAPTTSAAPPAAPAPAATPQTPIAPSTPTPPTAAE